MRVQTTRPVAAWLLKLAFSVSEATLKEVIVTEAMVSELQQYFDLFDHDPKTFEDLTQLLCEIEKHKSLPTSLAWKTIENAEILKQNPDLRRKIHKIRENL
eukprot:GHVP01055385.1.p1 GENE.GHVP01055385.1~~GHVP01055385.1.p1  ORF type:complete len:101 (+),score=21.22 GHVP01055385.1:144-446(+)